MTAPRALHRYAQFTVAFTAFVIFAGAMVTSTRSGMAVPDWPLSFDQWMPRMEGGVFYEHGHRMVAGALGVLVLVLALWAAFFEPRPNARRLAWGALAAVALQAGLGGLTVLIGTAHGWGHTHPVVSTAHACLAQALFAALVTYAVITAKGWSLERASSAQDGLVLKAMVLVVLIYLQIIIGATMRHRGAGFIIPDFPLSYGQLIPTFHNVLVAVNFAHRVGGWLILLWGSWFALRVALNGELDPWVRRPAKVLLVTVLLQFLLGASVVWTHLGKPALTSLHVLGGSVVFTSALVLALRLRRLSAGT